MPALWGEGVRGGWKTGAVGGPCSPSLLSPHGLEQLRTRPAACVESRLHDLQPTAVWLQLQVSLESLSDRQAHILDARFAEGAGTHRERWNWSSEHLVEEQGCSTCSKVQKAGQAERLRLPTFRQLSQWSSVEKSPAQLQRPPLPLPLLAVAVRHSGRYRTSQAR